MISEDIINNCNSKMKKAFNVFIHELGSLRTGRANASMLDIIKSQTMYLMATEESAKRIARDIDIYKRRDDVREIKESGGSSSSQDGTTLRGSKDLMKLIRDGMNPDEIEDVEITE